MGAFERRLELERLHRDAISALNKQLGTIAQKDFNAAVEKISEMEKEYRVLMYEG